ncbi:MAG: tRNA 2-thiouridine(34) synthase MnmA [Eubacteriaceae bacterium]|nr:tRNA 2-thiouridine(34) synthase MnmA [Eubacteriaceae bacterium]
MGKNKVIVGMSGGVDSAVTAYLLKQAGYEVIGVTLRTWQADEGQGSRCCDIDDARAAADRIGIRYLSFNCTADFQRYVVDPFLEGYRSGITPNPCIECNRYVKWDKLLYYAKLLEGDYIATGHYAYVVKLDNGRYTLKKALHSEKDQTYMLYKLTQEQLAATLMPLGSYTKSAVRKIAEEAGLAVASKPDSQEICFVSNGGYADYIKDNSGAVLPGEGFFVDDSGKILGRHKGIVHYTVGQRKGLGIAFGYPVYVKEIRSSTNEIVLSDEQSLYSSELFCRDVNFMSISGLQPGVPVRCSVKIRYRHEGMPAVITAADNGSVKVRFEEPAKAITPGQSAVFYNEEDEVIGGGVIAGTRQ